MAKAVLLGIATLSLFYGALAFVPIPSQDFCVADIRSRVRVNGVPCKDPSTVTVDDFYFSGLKPGNTSNRLGSGVTLLTVNEIPGINTLGLTMGRADYAANGIVPPHYHPRATEILTVLEGELEVGFVTSLPSNKHFSKILKAGDVFVVPHGLIHYQRNPGKSNVAVIFAFNSQSAGVVLATLGIFGASPDINPDFLAKSYQLDKNTILDLQKKF